MDTKQLIIDTKARFAHNAAREYLKEKYNGKLLIAHAGGLWRADKDTISFLAALIADTVVLLDTFNKPISVNRTALLEVLIEKYTEVMTEWHREWTAVEEAR
jgi:hypothetical protein